MHLYSGVVGCGSDDVVVERTPLDVHYGRLVTEALGDRRFYSPSLSHTTPPVYMLLVHSVMRILSNK